MVTLGVDPGMRSTGMAVLVDGKVAYRTTVFLAGHGKLPVAAAVPGIAVELKQILSAWRPSFAAVEQVGWYGRAKGITLPLSHVAGFITGYLVASGVNVCLLYAKQKVAAVKFMRKRGEPVWDEHQKDAAVLARVVYNYLKDGGRKPTILKHQINYAKRR